MLPSTDRFLHAISPFKISSKERKKNPQNPQDFLVSFCLRPSITSITAHKWFLFEKAFFGEEGGRCGGREVGERVSSYARLRLRPQDVSDLVQTFLYKNRSNNNHASF